MDWPAMIFDFGREDAIQPMPYRRRWGWGAGLEFVLVFLGTGVATFVIILWVLT